MVSPRLPHLVSLGGFLLCVTVLILLPEAIRVAVAPGYATIRSVQTVDIQAAPDRFHGQASFELGGATKDSRVRCTRVEADGASLNRYRCETSQRRKVTEPSTSEILPRNAGWSYSNVGPRNVDTEIEPGAGTTGLWLLPSILLAGLGYHLLRDRTRPATPVRSAVALVVAVVALHSLIDLALSPWASAEDATVAASSAQAMRLQPLSWIVGAVILGPVLEELVFRGLGWNLLARTFPVPVVAALTTLLFTVGHVHDWALALSVLAAGALLALVRIRTGSVMWCVIAHSAINAVTLSVWYMT